MTAAQTNGGAGRCTTCQGLDEQVTAKKPCFTWGDTRLGRPLRVNCLDVLAAGVYQYKFLVDGPGSFISVLTVPEGAGV